jgi:site-specific recombinase XerD
MIQFSVTSTQMGFPKKDRLLERFIQYQEVERSASPRTIIAYRHALLRFKEFRDVTWDAATPADFRLFLLECMKSGASIGS